MLEAERQQLRRARGIGGVPQLDGALHHFAEIGVGHADHGGVGDGGMAQQHALDLGRVDVHAARQDEIGAPVAEIEKALRVDMAEIAVGRPAARVIGGLRLVRCVVIGERRREAGEPDAADLARRQFRPVGAADMDLRA